ncbi:YqaA family protein [Kordiimonas laminariae]|uniref:YqaA family protein n=1 Tax=Kordiimonas laminariae TaxID=2917717 RepID=UPI001FF69267|nr:DedA family protein [Kordiimonas laminariae]
MLGDLAIYGGLFVSAFIAATLLPAFSELSFAASLSENAGVPLFLFIAVTSGNVLGACLNWWIGSKIVHFQSRSWFPFSPNQIAKAEHHFARYGKWSLLFAWLPVVGDPLTLVAGILRTNLLFFLTLVSIGKATRYVVIWFGISQI